MRLAVIAIALTITAPLAAQPFEGARSSLPQDRFYGRIGAIAASADTNVRIDLPRLGVSGTLIDFESDFGLGRNQWVAAGELGYRFNPRWRVEFEFWTLDREAARSIARTIQMEDVTFEAGARATARFVSSLYNVDVHWTPIYGSSYDVGFSLGAHITDFVVGVEGEATVNETVAFRSVRKTQLAPLPTIGTNARLRLADRLVLIGAAEVFALEIDGYKGRLVDAELGLVWTATPQFGLGVSARTLDYRLRMRRDNWTGRISYALTGPSLFATLAF